MIIFNQTTLLGDSLATFPAILEAANHQKVYLISANSHLINLIPKHPNLKHIYNVEEFFEIPDFEK